jgi:hypothetical protein
MPLTPEPCNCGAEDCPRCRPDTYKLYLAYRAWEELCDEDMDFETYVKKLNEEEQEEPWP